MTDSYDSGAYDRPARGGQFLGQKKIGLVSDKGQYPATGQTEVQNLVLFNWPEVENIKLSHTI